MVSLRVLTILVVAGTWTSAAPLHAADDPIAMQLKREAAIYRNAREAYARKVEAWLARQEKSTKVSGDVSAILEIEAIRDQVQSNESLPPGTHETLRGYRKTLWVAEDRMTAQLATAASKYRKRRMEEKAKEIESKLIAFQQQTDRIPIGSHWEGTWTLQGSNPKSKPTTGIAKVQVLTRDMTSFTIQAAMSDQQAWQYEVKRDDHRNPQITRARLSTVQHNFGEPIGDKMILKSAIAIEGDQMSFNVVRPTDGGEVFNLSWAVRRVD